MREYVHLSNRSDAALGHFGQIPPGRRNDFHLDQKHAWKGIQPSRRMFSSVMFVIPAPRQRDYWVRTLIDPRKDRLESGTLFAPCRIERF